jgi:choline dehydrogenase-like flavoprotein
MAQDENAGVHTADVVVVGSGSAGAVIARRLVDAGASVLLLEAGLPDDNAAIHDPARLFELWDSEQDWGYRTVPQAGCAGRGLHWPRGRVLGGSSALNGMIYARGARADYAGWAAAGNRGWDYHEVLPLFKRSEDFDRGADLFHGSGGPLAVMSRYEPHPVTAAAVAAAQEAGIPFNDDHNGAELDGVGFCQLTIRGGRRHSVADAFLRPALDSPQLALLTSARACRLVFEGTRCVGVEVARGGALELARARHEVVVCAGTIESPRLLLLSGIGPADRNRRLGIEPLVDLRGVGQNLHDHLLSPVIFTAKRPVPPPLPGLQPLHAHLFARTRGNLDRPDIQPLFFHLPLYAEGQEGPADGFTLMGGAIRPVSRGSLRLVSADPEDDLLIDPSCLASDYDVAALAAAVRLCREIGREPALAEWTREERYPGPGVQSARDLYDYVRRTAVTYHHQVGTCRMGVDEMAVVDPELRVRGVEGLRVADASVMPEVTSGNTHAPTVMIGERASDLVVAALA